MYVQVSHEFVDRYSLAATIGRLIVALLGLFINFYMGLNLFCRKRLRNQTQVLLCNVIITDGLLCLVYVVYDVFQIQYNFDIPYHVCSILLAPFLWLSLALPCLTVAGTRARLVQAVTYGDSVGGVVTKEPWKLRSALISMWTFSLLAAFCVFLVDYGLPLSRAVGCVFPLNLSQAYLVSYFIFTSTASCLVVFEHLRFLQVLVFGEKLHDVDDDHSPFEFHLQFAPVDKQAVGHVIIGMGLYLGCWVPTNLLTMYTLNSYDVASKPTVIMKLLMQSIWCLPLVHSTISPLFYICLDADLCGLRPRAHSRHKRDRSKSVQVDLVMSSVNLALPVIAHYNEQRAKPDHVYNTYFNQGYVSEYI